MTTLYLDPTTWDLVADATGNIAVATDAYAVAQDAATEVRTFQGEVYYDTTKGVPYFQQILGRFPPLQAVKSALVTAALRADGAQSAKAFITGVSGRQIQGQLHITDSTGTTVAISF